MKKTSKDKIQISKISIFINYQRLRERLHHQEKIFCVSQIVHHPAIKELKILYKNKSKMPKESMQSSLMQ